MRILIIGAGEVGFHLARRLSDEGHDVVLIESNPDRAEYVADQLDVLTITGNGASLPVLQRAGIGSARLVLAVTSRDEVNVLCCLAAARSGAEFKVARIGNPEYYQQGSVLSGEQLGIDLMINPERECAWETFQLLNSEAATDLIRFADDRIQLIGLRVRPEAEVSGMTLAEMDLRFRHRHFVTVGIVRNNVTIVPHGETRIDPGDHLFVMAPSAEMAEIPAFAGYTDYKLRRVMIAGGSEEAVHLARLLGEQRVECTILDHDRRRCLELAELLPHALILHGDATNIELLEMEGVEGIDGFVASTGHDEVNMLSSLIAKTSGARKVISVVNRFEYVRLIGKFGIDAAVSARQSTVGAIMRYIRRGNVQSVGAIKGSPAEAIELHVANDAAILGTPLADADFPREAVVGAIVRGDTVIMPRGRDHIEAGDRVVIFAMPSAIPEIERLFA
jgi:trk system potassium uptake protein